MNNRVARADGSCVSNLWGSSQRDTKDGKAGQSIDIVAAFALPDGADGGATPRDPFSTIDHQRLVGAGDGEPCRTGGLDIKSEHPGAGVCLSRETSWRAFASSWSWDAGRSRGSISPRKSIWDGGWWPSRCRGPMVTSPGFSRGSSMLISCRYTRSATTRQAACASCACRISGGPTSREVLRASGGLVPTRHDGGSLVKALDQVSRKLPDDAGVPPTHRISQPLLGRRTRARTRRIPRRLCFDRRAAARRSRRPPVFAGCSPGWSGQERVHCRRASERLGPEREEPSRQFLRGASAIQAAVWIVARLAEGLEHAHARGLLHRDLKPSNILLAADGTPMLLDFNLAVENPVDSPEGEIQRALIGGTLPYMSPEHLDAFNPCGTTSADAVDERSDIYAPGADLL